MNPEQLYDSFAVSGYGQLLETRTRFNDFKPDWVGTDTWCNLLGDDVNNLRHMDYTLGLAKRFVELQEIESNDLLVTAATHDWGEAIIGDIALPSKTEADETREKFAYRRIAKEILRDEARDLSRIVMPILFDKSVPEADMFRSIEYVGYTSTALKAGRVAIGLLHDFVDLDIPRHQREELMGGLMALNRAVEAHNLPTVRDYAKKYPAVRTMVSELL